MVRQIANKKQKKRFFTLKRQEAALGWLFVSPALIGFSIFTFGSILYSLYLSMTDWNLLSQPNWIGLDNYIRAFTDDKYFYKYFGNTFYFVFALVPIVLVISLMLALLINKKVGKISNAYRVALFLPSITSTVAVSMVWIWIFNPNMGVLNNILMAIGWTSPPMWLADPEWSKPALVIMRVWQMGGYYMIMFLAGLQTIPENLYEAAEVDGAWRGNANTDESLFVCGDVRPTIAGEKLWCIDAQNTRPGYLNMETGELVWTSTLTNVSSRGMATDGTLVFYVSNSGRQLTAFNASTNEIVWQKDLRYNSRDGDLQEMQIDSGLVYQDGVIFHVAERGRITAIDASNGTILWRIDAAGFPERVFWSTPEVNGNIIIANGIDGKVYAVEFTVE